MESPIFSDFFLHLDMDAFFAAVEQRDKAELRGLPVIVCGSSPTRAVVSTCSYEARLFGVRSAMTVARAKELCPQALLVVGRMAHYRAISQELMLILAQYSAQVEPLSIDEAFLRINKQCSHEDALLLANKVKEHVYRDLRLTCSIGIASNKFLAKLASNQAKPAGIAMVNPSEAQGFLANLTLSDLYGVGRALEKKLNNYGIHTTKQLQETSLMHLQQAVGIHQAWQLFQLAQGIDIRGKEPRQVRNRSLGHETTFDWDLYDEETLHSTLMSLVYRLWYRLLLQEESASTIKIKLKYADFKEVQQQRTFNHDLRSAGECYRSAKKLLLKINKRSCGIRLVGITLTGLHKEPTRNLFSDLYEEREAIVERIAHALSQQNILLTKARIYLWRKEKIK